MLSLRERLEKFLTRLAEVKYLDRLQDREYDHAFRKARNPQV